MLFEDGDGEILYVVREVFTGKYYPKDDEMDNTENLDDAIKLKTIGFCKVIRCPDGAEIVEYFPATKQCGAVVVKAGED